MDGQQQRGALTAATSALRALAAGHATRAVAAAGKAAALDQLGMYAAFAEWVGRAAEEVEEFGRVLPATRDGLRDSLGPGPLAAAVQEWLA